MPKGFVRTAAVSVPVHLGDVDANVKEIIAAMENLRQSGVQAAVFPELCLTGYTLGDLLLRPALQRAAWNGMLAVAEQTGDMAAIVGLPVALGSSVYDCAAALCGGTVLGMVPRTDPERRWFSPAPQER